MRKPLLTFTLAAWFVFAYGASAHALEVGGLQLSGGLSTGAGYNTNLFFQGVREDRTSAFFSTVRPSLQISTVSPRFFDYSARFRAEWQEYLNERAVTRSQGGVFFDLENRLLMNRGGHVSVEPFVNVRRDYELYYDPAGDPLNSWNVSNNLRLNVHPGGQRSSRIGFSGNVAGFYQLQRYDGRERNDRDSFGGRGTLRYNIVPKTAVFVSGGAGRTMFRRDGQSATLPGGEEVFLRNRDSSRYTFGGGFSGAFTRHWGLLLRVGNQWTVPDEQEAFSSLWILTQSRLQLTDRLDWSLGYRRENRDSSFGGNFLSDRFFSSLSWNQRAFSSDVNASLHFRRFSEVLLEDGQGGAAGVDLFDEDRRSDTLLHLSAGVRQGIRGGFGVSLRYRYARLLSDYEIRSSFDPDELIDLEFVQHAVSLALSYRF